MPLVILSLKRMSISKQSKDQENKLFSKQIVFNEGFFKSCPNVQSLWSYGPYLAFLDSSESVFTLIPFITGMAQEATG